MQKNSSEHFSRRLEIHLLRNQYKHIFAETFDVTKSFGGNENFLRQY